MKQLTATGWDVCTNEWEPALRHNPETFFDALRMDWSWHEKGLKAEG